MKRLLFPILVAAACTSGPQSKPVGEPAPGTAQVPPSPSNPAGAATAAAASPAPPAAGRPQAHACVRSGGQCKFAFVPLALGCRMLYSVAQLSGSFHGTALDRCC